MIWLTLFVISGCFVCGGDMVSIQGNVCEKCGQMECFTI